MTAKNDDSWMRDYFSDDLYERPVAGQLAGVAFNKVFERLERLEAAIIGDMLLRKQYPAVNDAWEQYQTVLALVKSGEQDET